MQPSARPVRLTLCSTSEYLTPPPSVVLSFIPAHNANTLEPAAAL